MAGHLDSESVPLLDSLITATRSLGQDPSLVLHGGGNSSVKARWRDITGAVIPALLVKGSGHDMAVITEEGFAPLRLERIRELLPPTQIGDLEFADELRCAGLDSRAPAASVETLVHAFLPHTAVLHSHADVVLAVTNTANCLEHLEQVFGRDVLVVDYAMPGPDLGAAVKTAWEDSPVDTAELRGMVVREHGLFTFGDTPEEALAHHRELVAKAEGYVRQRRPQLMEVADFPTPAAQELASLRRQISEAAGYSLVMRRSADEEVSRFINDSELVNACQKGPATPDHVIWTRNRPMLGVDLDRYCEESHEYFRQHSQRRDVDLIELDPAPRVVLDRRLGLLSLGRNAREARISEDIYRHTISTITDARILGGYEPADAGHVFDLEYWAPQQEKLKRANQHAPLAGRIALVTGAASGIGRACAEKLLDAGATVVGWDISEKVTTTFESPEWLGMQVDVTKEGAQEAALNELVRALGGLDIVVVSAGIFPAAQHLNELDFSMWRRTMAINVDAVTELYGLVHPLLKESFGGGRVVVIASKNVAAPGPGAAAYSSSKAALTQLSRVAALEWAPDGIRVNMLHPDAVFDTALWTEDLLNQRAEHYGMSIEEYKRRNLLSAEVTSAAVGRLATAVASDLFDVTTGAQIPVDGGNQRVV